MIVPKVYFLFHLWSFQSSPLPVECTDPSHLRTSPSIFQLGELQPHDAWWRVVQVGANLFGKKMSRHQLLNQKKIEKHCTISIIRKNKSCQQKKHNTPKEDLRSSGFGGFDFWVGSAGTKELKRKKCGGEKFLLNVIFTAWCSNVHLVATLCSSFDGQNNIFLIIQVAHLLITISTGQFSWVDSGVSKNRGTPKSSILIGFSIIFTIHFGIPLSLETPSSRFQQDWRLTPVS